MAEAAHSRTPPPAASRLPESLAGGQPGQLAQPARRRNGTTRSAGTAAPRSSGGPDLAACDGHGRGRLLRAVGKELMAWGLEVRDFECHGIPTHIEVNNPNEPDRGTFSIGWDGYLIWERWGPVKDAAEPDRIVQITVGALYGPESAPGRDDR
jgi:hypothetical protein